MTLRTPINLIIVDDHPLFRQGLRQVLDADQRFRLLGDASNGRDALQLIKSVSPDVVVLDIGLPDITGLEVAEQLQQQQSAVGVVMLTMLKDELAFNKAMSVGVMGYVLKENAVSEIVAAIIAVASATPYISPSLSAYLLRRHDRSQVLLEHTPGLLDLTLAERRILKRIADKKTSKDIAQELSVSPRTVETHRANICAKLNLKGNNSLLQFALEHREQLAQLK